MAGAESNGAPLPPASVVDAIAAAACRFAPPLLTAHSLVQVVVHSDSNLCIQTLTQWAEGWEQKGWVKGDGKQPKVMHLQVSLHAPA